VLSYGLFCVIVRTLYCTDGIASVDLVNCYDAIAYPVATFALQSFRVRIVMLAMMLYVLQDIMFPFELQLVNQLYFSGETKDNPTMDLAQGNGGAHG